MRQKFLKLILFCLLLITAISPPGAAAGAKYTGQYKAIWFSYFDYQLYLDKYKENNAANFRCFFAEVVANCKSRGFNHLIVHVRPCADAIYKSDYFPTSVYIAGRQGAALTYDPLKIMVEETHKQGLAIEAWINPYRITNRKIPSSELSEENIASRWQKSDNPFLRRNVLNYKGRLYLNPAKKMVRQLIIDGVREIVKNYDIDGIHLDDYFYPKFSEDDYDTAFDAPEYHHSREKAEGIGIADFRRRQVNFLVTGLRSAVKDIKPDITFGISPSGIIDHLTDEYQYYVDIEKWCSSDQYVDYILPQLYWGFRHRCLKYDMELVRWQKITDQSKVKLYIGLPAYKMLSKKGTTPAEDKEFHSRDTLKKMIAFARSKNADGVAVFDYRDIINPAKQECIDAMTEELTK